VVIGYSGTRQARPAKLVLTELARHVVAALVFFDSSSAYGAHLNVFLVLLGPPSQLIVHRLFTGNNLSVPLIFAAEADPGFTLGTLQLDTILVVCAHVFFAAGLGAVSN